MSALSTRIEKEAGRHLFLGTVSFTICFAAWGLISAFLCS
jgi:nitrate/nitrite transporter NarK